MLQRITNQARIRRFVVYDLEWKPRSYQLRLVGVYDSDDGYRRYTDVASFLDKELTPIRNGYWFYAHAGGLADLQFVLEEIITNRPDYSVEGYCSGGSVVRATVRHGRCKWVFVDSYWLLRAPLRDIAKWIGESKTGPTESMTDAEREDWYANVDLEILTEYNRNDCVVLWKAIYQTQCQMLETGGQLQTTAASSALTLFRRKYLTAPLSPSNRFNEVARASYFASRVEVIQQCVPYRGVSYDVNSSFPFAMTFTLPGDMTGMFGSILDRHWNHPFIADCDVLVPDSFLPSLPRRLKDGRVFFPVGKWRGIYTAIDLRLLLDCGGKILRVYRCWTFADFTDLRDFAKDMFAKRKAAITPFEKQFYKLVLNSPYGKFAEQSDKEGLWINPPPHALANLNRQLQMLFPGCFVRTMHCYLPHVHVPIASYITAIARRTLYQFMAACSEVHYCDTDGFSTTDELRTGLELGELKIEKTFPHADFYRPKLYAWESEEGDLIIKAKGFPKLTREQFLKLVGGGEVSITRMARIKENLRKGITRPHDQTGKGGKQLTKALNPNYIGKRFYYPDGYSRPWHIKELE